MQDKNNTCTRKRVSKNRRTYTCSECKYESNRNYNVMRHQERIHWNLRLHVCCGIQFFNKGDYYVHCEQTHPHTRLYRMTSRNKYKITNESFDHHITDTQISNSWKLQLKQQFSNKISIIDQRLTRKLKSKLTLRYLGTCSDFEDIPLMNFLTDQRLESYLKILPCSKSPSNVTKRDNRSKKQNQSVKIAISSTQNVEKELSEDGVSNYQTKVSSSSSISLKLPTKKLILHRFRSDVVQKCEIPLRERNNNCDVQVDLAEKQAEENTPSVRCNRAKKYKRFNRGNKENVSKFPFNLEEQLNLKLDRNITVPVATQLHRDFLDAIDFDQYKIF
ncbi:uncharacterized protein LOC114875908 [Osmia bicornis bicornis]|uniref:uncharacterized protein LOC114875908 n=1 Tax=Osmia bicornis bicornis TaxID=1437191 RepID=UPI001EAEBF21|nr:uncharacterized protein LOC114875908 [Osmia bicornis bicornis]